MHIHRASCIHNYTTTDDEVFTVEKIVGVFGHIDDRRTLVSSEMVRVRGNANIC